MRFFATALPALAVALALCGCGTNAHDVDYSQQRGISSDISSSLDHGPTAGHPGMMGSEEPIGAFPWTIPQNSE
jgi:hypothetical protein